MYINLVCLHVQYTHTTNGWYWQIYEEALDLPASPIALTSHERSQVAIQLLTILFCSVHEPYL